MIQSHQLSFPEVDEMNGTDIPTAHGLTDLHVAVILGEASRVHRILIDHNNKGLLDVGDVDGATPLMTAVLTGRLTIARLLLQNGASPHVRDRRGHQAVSYSKVGLFKTKLGTYKRLGFPEIGPEQRGKRVAVAKILRYPAVLESWFVPPQPIRCAYFLPGT